MEYLPDSQICKIIFRLSGRCFVTGRWRVIDSADSEISVFLEGAAVDSLYGI